MSKTKIIVGDSLTVLRTLPEKSVHYDGKTTLISLFVGIGGFDLGFERAGFRIAAHVEKDANCQKLLSEKWPDAVALDDVRTAGAHNLPPCDVITFGFPCQDLSIAGKRAGLKGKRSGLFYEATRIIDELKPSFCLFENVPGLLSSDDGRDFARVLMEMDKIGYNGAWRVFDAQWFGVAQRRRRVFGLFSRLDSGAERCAEILSIRESLCGHLAPSREAGEGVARGFETGPGGGRFTGVAPTMDCRAKDGPIRNQLGVGAMIPMSTNWDFQRARIVDPDGCLESRTDGGGFPGTDGACAGHVVPAVMAHGQGGAEIGENVCPTLNCNHEQPIAFCGETARTLTARVDSSPRVDRGMNMVAQFQWASGGGKMLNQTDQSLRSGAEHNYQFAQVGMRVRRLTPIECERLQGFPDGWTAGFSDTTRYRMLGNAVCVNVSEWIAKRLIREFQNT